jgi:hypothetical protein
MEFVNWIYLVKEWDKFCEHGNEKIWKLSEVAEKLIDSRKGEIVTYVVFKYL